MKLIKRVPFEVHYLVCVGLDMQLKSSIQRLTSNDIYTYI